MENNPARSYFSLELQPPSTHWSFFISFCLSAIEPETLSSKPRHQVILKTMPIGNDQKFTILTANLLQITICISLDETFDSCYQMLSYCWINGPQDSLISCESKELRLTIEIQKKLKNLKKIKQTRHYCIVNLCKILLDTEIFIFFSVLICLW